MARTPTVAPPLPPSPLPADLVQALRRLKIGTVRRLAPEVLHTAKVQRWTPEEVLRTLIEAECASRDESNRPTARSCAASGQLFYRRRGQMPADRDGGAGHQAHDLTSGESDGRGSLVGTVCSRW